MDYVKLNQVGIDINEGLKRMNGNEEFYKKLLVYFIKDDNFNLMKESIKNGSYDEAFTACHTLKGVTGNLSIVLLYNKICELTEVLRQKEYDKIGDFLSPVEEIYLKVINVLKEELNV